MSDENFKRLKDFGGGNASAGLRKLLSLQDNVEFERCNECGDMDNLIVCEECNLVWCSECFEIAGNCCE